MEMRYVSMIIQLRPLQLPEDYGAIAKVLNQFWAEPTSAAKLQEGDEKLYQVGHTRIDENGLLVGYDRERLVAMNEHGEIIGYAGSWRASWTEPGCLCNTIVVAETYRKQGIGQLLLRHIVEWGSKLGATTFATEVWDDDTDALHFAYQRGFTIDRHSFQSVLEMNTYDEHAGLDVLHKLQQEGFRFLTLADEPGEESERKLYEIYKESLFDIPGYRGDVPNISEWRKWYLNIDGYQPELVILAAEEDKYIGVTHLLHNPQTKGMYHEYTGVCRSYRGRQIGLALKLLAAQVAKRRKAPYIRTDNDSMNKPILSINQRLGYTPLRGHYRIVAPLKQVLRMRSSSS
jgi:GNAT superfamily N-acetyltransferase